MFSFFKNKTVLDDLIPKDHVDFHSHILFGIDDGAKTPEDSLLLAKSLQDKGCSQLIATPHVMYSVWENTSEGILSRLEQTQTMLQQNGVSIPVRAAAEYLIDSFFVQRLKSEELLTIGGNHVLVEMSYLNAPIQLYDIIFEIQLAGYTPVLAHPERYSFYHRNFKEYAKLKDAGCKFQVNLLSAVGYYGQSVAETADRLLNEDYIDFAGSDVHHSRHIAAFSKRLVIKSDKKLEQALSNNAIFKF